MIRKFLAHPLTRAMDLDNAQTTALRKEVLASKPFLQKIYLDWYALLSAEVNHLLGIKVELGSGAGFLKQHIPGLKTSEVFFLPFIDVVLDGMVIPFANNTISAMLMVDVFHHIPNVAKFLSEVERILLTQGRLVLIEPWVSNWSSIVYPRLHHEPYDTAVKHWQFSATGPLSASNQALPWIVFQRDAALFQQKFPSLKICKIQPIMPFRYIFSGGIALRNLMPSWTYRFWRAVDRFFERNGGRWGMFALIVLEKIK